jgi:hypothetical protein
MTFEEIFANLSRGDKTLELINKMKKIYINSRGKEVLLAADYIRIANGEATGELKDRMKTMILRAKILTREEFKGALSDDFKRIVEEGCQ